MEDKKKNVQYELIPNEYSQKEINKIVDEIIAEHPKHYAELAKL